MNIIHFDEKWLFFENWKIFYETWRIKVKFQYLEIAFGVMHQRRGLEELNNNYGRPYKKGK